MPSIKIDIPEDIISTAKIPRKRIAEEIKKELALHLYSEGILSLGNARKLSGLNKWDFHFQLGKRKIERHYEEVDYQKDLENLNKWRKS